MFFCHTILAEIGFFSPYNIVGFKKGVNEKGPIKSIFYFHMARSFLEVSQNIFWKKEKGIKGLRLETFCYNDNNNDKLSQKVVKM